jgi:hypothetical protein
MPTRFKFFNLSVKMLTNLASQLLRKEKSIKSPTVEIRYTVGQDQNLNTNKNFATVKLQIFAVKQISFTLSVPSF